MALGFFLGKQKPCFSILSLIGQIGSPLRNISLDVDRELTESTELNSEQENRDRRLWSQCVNEVKLLGRVGAEPQLKYSMEKKPLVYVPVLTESFFRKNSGEIIKSTMRHKVIIKEPFVQEFCLHQVVKGSKVFISGSLQNQKIMLESDGEEPTLVTYVRADKFLLLRKPRLIMEQRSELSESSESEQKINREV